MEDTATTAPPPIPSIHLQPPSVDFIDTRLPDHHDRFKNTLARYDPSVGRYVPKPTTAVPQHGQARLLLGGVREGHDEDADQGEEGDKSKALEELPPRELPPEAAAMEFWALVFDTSLVSLKSKHSEPKGRSQSSYNIRDAKGWDDVYSRLQLARESYDGTKKGFWGRAKRTARKIADHASVAKQAAKFLPDGDYTTPVRAAVEVLLDAVKAASKVRQKVTKSFDSESLDRQFGEVELFLATFPRDENIKKASVELVVATLKAIEDTIGFFIQHSVKRGFSALAQGERYQESLLESIADVSTYSERLVHEAQNSHIAATRQGIRAVLQRTRRIETMQEATNEGVESLMDDMSVLKDADARLLNLVQALLDDGQKNRDMYLEVLKKVEQLEHRNEGLLHRLASTPPPPQNQLEWLPPPLPQVSPLQQLPGPPGAPHLLSWHVSPAGTHSFGPPVLASPQPVWSVPMAVQPWPAPPSHYYDLRGLVGLGNIDEVDIGLTMEDRDLTPAVYRVRAEQVAGTPQFREWALSPTSRELLVHGEQGLDGRHYAAALSVLCATMTRALRMRDRYLALVFFCGRHVEKDDEHTGAIALIRSLIVQLLRHHAFDTTRLYQHIDLERVRRGDIVQLCALFGWLVRQIPERMAVVCLIDGIENYENDEYEADMLLVLRYLLDLVRDEHLSPAVKILATSATATDKVQEAFKDDELCFVCLTELPRVGQGSTMSGWRVQEEDEEDEEELDNPESDLD